MTEQWQNRIVEYSDVPPDQLLAHPGNWRTHPGTQADALRGVMREVGIVQNVIANKRSGFLIDGHLRVMEALKAGQPTIPVTWVDLSDEEEALVLLTIDPLSAMAGTDAAQLEELMREASTAEAGVQALLDGIAQKAGLVPGEPVDVDELWKGMPDYENEAEAARTLHIHFPTLEDCERFCELLDVSITDKTKTIWYPEPPEHIKYRFVSDES